MKTAGTILITVGLIITLLTGLGYVTTEKAVGPGKPEMPADTRLTVHWQPYLGIAAMLMGGAVLLLGRKRAMTT